MEGQLRPAAYTLARSAKAAVQIRFTAIAYNLKRTLTILAATA